MYLCLILIIKNDLYSTRNGKHVPYPNEVYISLQSGQIICQNCRQNNEAIQPNPLKLINDTISNATVRCPNFIPDDEGIDDDDGIYKRTNSRQGCHWSGKTIHLPDHFAECKYSQVKCLYCIFTGTKGTRNIYLLIHKFCTYIGSIFGYISSIEQT